MSEQEFKRFNNYHIRSKDVLNMCREIILLVASCHNNFLITCNKAYIQNKLLTPFASKLHEEKKVQSRLFQVASCDPSTHNHDHIPLVCPFLIGAPCVQVLLPSLAMSNVEDNKRLKKLLHIRLSIIAAACSIVV